MTDSADLLARLERLESRLAALEARATPSAPPAGPKEVFWALERLERDAPEGAVLFSGHVRLPTGEHWAWQEGQDTPALLNADWQGAAPALAALGHPLRLAVLRAVLNGRQTTQDLQGQPDLGGAGKLYHHLRELQAAGWLTLEGRGRYVVPAQKVIPLLVILRASGGVAAPDVDEWQSVDAGRD